MMTLVACGGGTGSTTDRSHDVARTGTSPCVDAELHANLSVDEYKVARIDYRRAEPAYSSAAPEQQAEAEFALHRPFVEATPPGAQARYARQVCTDLEWLGILRSPQLKTAATGFGYYDCASASHPNEAAGDGNAKELRDAYRRIHIAARTTLCPQAEGTS